MNTHRRLTWDVFEHTEDRFGRGPLRQRTASPENAVGRGFFLPKTVFSQWQLGAAREQPWRPGSTQEGQEAVREQPGSSQRGQGAARKAREQPGPARNSKEAVREQPRVPAAREQPCRPGPVSS